MYDLVYRERAQISSIPGTQNYQFQKEIPVTEGNNNFQITATDARGNARTQNYSVQVEPAQKTYEYDLNGNLLREKDPVGTVIRSFEWDGADRIKAVNWGSQRIEWTYNGLGQRVLETVNGVASKRFLWDGIELLLEKTPAHTITKKFYGDGEQRVGGTDAGNYYYTRDHVGSVREVVNQSCTLQARYDYDAYGKRSVLYQDAAYLGGCTFGYTGHITLNSLAAGQSELVLTLFRVYDPELGRWLSADPIGEAGGMNLYAYCYGNPLSFSDPNGKIPIFLITAGIGALVGGVVGGLTAKKGKFWKGVGKGVLVGGIAGLGGWAGASIATSYGATAVSAAVIGGAVSGAVGSTLSQAIDCPSDLVTGKGLSKVAASALLGAVTAGLGSKIAPGIERAMQGASSPKQIAKFIEAFNGSFIGLAGGLWDGIASDSIDIFNNTFESINNIKKNRSIYTEIEIYE